MAKKKKEVTNESQYKKYRNQYVALKCGKYASIITPFVTLAVVKWDEYFQFSMNNGSSVKLSIGCMLAMLVGGISIYNEVKGENKQTSEVSSVIKWAVAFALCYFFQTILNDLTLILGCALAGQLAGLGFEIGAENRAYYKEKYRDVTITSNATSEALKKVLGGKGNVETKEKSKPFE